MTWLWVADGDNGVAADRCLTGFGDGHHTRVSDGLRFETLVHGEPEHDRQVGAANQKEVEAAEVRPSHTAAFGAQSGRGRVQACSGCSSSDAATGSDPDRLPVAGVGDAPV